MEKLRERVMELLDYDPATGIFTWKVRRGCRPAGSEAGALRSDGYTAIRINGKDYLAHRLAFLLSHGYLPKEIDHINLIKDDNRIENLREATRQENLRNTGKNSKNTSGYKGVCWHKHNGKWCALAQDANRRRKFLGYFHTPEAASAAYEAYAITLHGAFYRPQNQEELT